MQFGEVTGQGWLQIEELGLAFVLSSLIGLEREIAQKSAGLRTHTLVGLGAALVMLISKYGFTDILVNGRIVVDPSRVAAQVVSGIGFIGGGLIFVRRDNVRGLTTAAIIWVTAAVGMACGGGLPVLAILATALHFTVVFGFRHITMRLPKSRWVPSVLQLSYEDGREVLRDVLLICTQHDFAVSRLRFERSTQPRDLFVSGNLASPKTTTEPTRPHDGIEGNGPDAGTRHIATVVLEVQGVRSVSKLAAKLAGVDGVVSVHAGDVNVPSD
jgi:putative Mg2+ transporter-C (MgtC) family protein